MSVLVTGGAGYIGSHMVLALLDAGEDVLVIDNLSTGFRWAVPDDAKFVEGDVGDHNLIDRLLLDNTIDAIIHFAGSIVVPESISNPLGYYLNNTCKSRTLIACAVANSVKHFIFSSTAAVYGTPRNNPVSEDARLEPISPYGSSKLMTEIMLRDPALAHDLQYVALRYFNVAGADPRGRSGQSTPNATHLIKVAAQAALGQRPYVEVFGTDYPTSDGTCVRDYIHVTDLIGAHLAALEYLRKGGDSAVLNCGYGRGFSVLEVIAAVKRAAKFDEKRFGVHDAEPFSDGLRGKLGAIVAANIFRDTASQKEPRKQSKNVLAVEPALHLDRQTLARELVNHRKHADLASIAGTVFDEVIRPDMIAMLGANARPVVQP